MAKIQVCDSCGSYLANELTIPISPTPQLWRTHDAPTAPERALIAELLIDAQQTVAQTDIKIEDIQTKLAGLITKRNSMQEVINCHDSLLSPIRCLPNELLRHIFFLCLPGSKSRPRISIKRAPLLLTQVCISWRTCALSSQRLWSSFNLSSKVPTHPSLMDHWLSRTLSSPLSIYMTVWGRDRACPIWPSISRSIQYCDRWQQLSVHMPTSILSRFGSVQYRLRLLEKLSLNVMNDDARPINIFEFAPRLFCVQLKSVINPSRLRLPWKQLETLEIRVGGMGQLFSILELSPNLTDLALDSGKVTSGDYSGSIVTLPNLLSLKISMRCDITNICDKMRCPALKSLNVLTSASSLMSNNFVSFVASSSSLERLSIHHQKADTFLDLVSCLAAAPTVSVLKLDVVIPKTSMSAVMHLMTDYPGSGGRILLPALEELSVMGNAPDARPFAKMIQSRNGNAIGGENIPQLKSAYLLDGIGPFDLSEEESRLFFDALDSGALKVMVPLEVKDIFDVHRRLCGEIRFDPGVLWS